MPKKIIIVRHGETQDNVERRFQGWIDTPLNETGLSQAQAVADRLKGEIIGAIYTSDLSRAKQTAEAISAILSLSVDIIVLSIILHLLTSSIVQAIKGLPASSLMFLSGSPLD